MKKASLLSMMVVLTSTGAHAGSTLGTCEYKTPNILDDKNEIMVSCDSALIALKSDEKGDQLYKKTLNEKLARSLAAQAKQILSDLGTTSDFFEQNDVGFILSPEMKNACRFQVFTEIEKRCGDQPLDEQAKERLAVLTKAIGALDNYQPKNFMDSFLHIYGTSKYGSGFEGESKNQCPAEGSNGLGAQLTASASKDIIEFFNSADSGGSREARYDSYPQLALIKNSDKLSPGFREKFEKYLSSFKKGKDDPQTFLQAFFFNPENMKIISLGVVSKCQQLQTGVISFVCHPLTKFSSSDPAISKKLFNNYNPRKEFQDQRADVKADPLSYKTFAYLCQDKKEKKLSNSIEIDSLTMIGGDACQRLKHAEDNTVDNYYSCFNQGLRADTGLVKDEVISNFCQRYSCQAPEVKDTPSCKAGGPLSSKDLAALKLENESIESEIAYLLTLEKHKADKANFLAYMDATSSGKPVDEKIKKSISEFDMNAFGAESMAKLIGLPATQQSIALVSEHMNNSGIRPVTKEEVTRVVERSNFDQAVRAMEQANQNNGFVVSNSAGAVIAANDSYNPSVHPAVKTSNDVSRTDAGTKNAFHTFNVDPGAKTKDAETEQMIKDLKTLMEDSKSKKSSENESRVAPETRSSNSGVSKALENEMQAWANRLANREASLRDRESLANIRDAEYWQKREQLRIKEAELATKEAEMKQAREPAAARTSAPVARSAQSSALQEVKTANMKLDQDLAATPAGLTVTPERLEKLDKNDLKENKVNIEEPFVISVRLKSKLVHVRVAKLKNGNQTYLAPYLNEDNQEVREAILKSPIFREFRYFLEQKEMAYTPVKKLKK